MTENQVQRGTRPDNAGGPAAVHCPTCASVVLPGSRYCPMCGMPIAVARPEPGRGSQARKNVVVLFTDLVGFTRLGERLDPEALSRLLDCYFRAATDAVAEHGGVIEKFIGDAVMAVFGLPVSHGDDGVRAVHAALQLHGEIARLNTTAIGDYGAALELRTGIGAGEVAVSTAPDGTYRVVGDAVNTSARLQQAADPGQIVLGHTSAWLVRGAVDLEPVAEVMVKGKAEPQRRWMVRGPVAAPTAPRTALIGRERERALLDAAFRRVGERRRGGLLVLSGDAGIGKTRLLAEAAADWTDARVLSLRCAAWGSPGPLEPVRSALAELLGADWIGELPRQLPDAADAGLVAEQLGRALGLREGGTSPQETAWSLRRVLEESARRQPLVLLCDDFQHAGPALLDLVRDTVPETRAPLLFVAAARPEFNESVPGWADAAGGELVEVGPLDAVDSYRQAVLLCAAARAEAPATGAAAAACNALRAAEVAAAAEGNPLFAEQFVSALLDDPGLAVPPTVQALLEARFDGLPSAERRLLQRASIVGREFAAEELEALAGFDPAVPLYPGLDGLLRRSALGRTGSAAAGPGGGHALQFVPGLLHDVAYGSLPKAERSSIHQQFARWLDRCPDSEPEVIGHHLETAYLLGHAAGSATVTPALAAAAAGRLIESARQADARGDVSTGAATLRRAQSLLPAGDPRQRAVGLLLCDLESELGDQAGAERALDAADAAIGADPTWPAVVELQRTLVAVRSDPGRLQRAAELVAATPAPEAARDHDFAFRRHLLTAHLRVSDMRYGDAGAELLAALAHAAENGRDRDRVLTGLAELALWGPEPVPVALARCENLTQRLGGDRGRLLPVQAAHAGLLALSGDVDSARRLAAVAFAGAEELRLTHARVVLRQMAGLIEALAGDHTAAATEYRTAAATFQDLGRRGVAASLDVLAARQLLEQGDAVASGALLGACRGMIDPGDVAAQVCAASLGAQLSSAAGQPEGAVAEAMRATELAERTDDLRGQGDAWLDLARVLRAARRPAEAGAAVRRATERYRAKGAAVLTEQAQRFERVLRLEQTGRSEQAGRSEQMGRSGSLNGTGQVRP